MAKYKPTDWDDEVEDLATRVKNGEPLALTREVTAILRKAAPTVGISDDEAERSLRTVTGATALLRKVRTRIHRGSWRVMNALNRMYKLRDARDLEGARQQMRDVLATDPAPHHRWIAEGQLRQLDDWKPTLKTDPPEWPDVRELAARLKAGRPLQLTPKVIAILKRAAPTVGLSDDETARGLRNVKSATALLRKMDWRIRRGANQLTEAAFQMYIRRDTGDIEGARQVMRDALAAEVVPHRRRIMEHYLEQLDRWRPPRSKQTPTRKAKPIRSKKSTLRKLTQKTSRRTPERNKRGR